ncbi:MAG: phage holin [Erysipelotrichaceae bacterium]|nr:phage holin [Erysipelotrichaceae bacterium]
MNDIIMIILEAIVSIAIVVVARYIVPAIKENMGTSNYETLLSFINSVVYAMQQTLEDNDEKKMTATAYVTEWVNDHGIDITSEQIDILIEAAVKELKLLEE